MQTVFNVRLCAHCRVLSKHALLGKTKAKEQFLLTDGDLKPLACLAKRNTTYARDGVVHLFLSSQLAEVALAKWGTWEELQDEQERRLKKRAGKRLQRRSGGGAAGSQDEAPPSPRRQAVLDRLQRGAKPPHGASLATAPDGDFEVM